MPEIYKGIISILCLFYYILINTEFIVSKKNLNCLWTNILIIIHIVTHS